MTSIKYNCLKCGHEMSRGFVVDTLRCDKCGFPEHYAI